jgi:hypothetical protein
MLMGRWDGPLALRLVLQPTMAAILGIRAGIGDARNGRPPYGWHIVTGPDHRRRLLFDGWRDIVKLFVVAVVLDLIYERYLADRRAVLERHLSEVAVKAAARQGSAHVFSEPGQAWPASLARVERSIPSRPSARCHFAS